MARTEYRQVPPIRDLFVHGHETGMNVRLFGKRATSLSPNLFAVVKVCVGEGCGDGCEREPVGNGERCGQEEGAVGLVSLDIE